MRDADPLQVRLVRGPDEVRAAQRLRYRVFCEEWGAQASADGLLQRRDFDDYDPIMDHLVVVDPGRAQGEQVVGTYRLLRHDRLRGRQFYSSHEFDLEPLYSTGERLLELGRSCVLREYRQRAVLQLLWQAIAAYSTEHRIGLMFGCASLRGTDPEQLREQLAYLRDHHLAPAELRPKVRADSGVAMPVLARGEYDARRAFRALEPIIKGYLRAGAYVGEGAYVDRQFNSTDVCIVMQSTRLAPRYANRFERAQRERPTTSIVESPVPLAACAG